MEKEVKEILDQMEEKGGKTAREIGELFFNLEGDKQQLALVVCGLSLVLDMHEEERTLITAALSIILQENGLSARVLITVLLKAMERKFEKELGKNEEQ